MMMMMPITKNDNDYNDGDNDEDLRRACYCFPPPALRGDPCGI